MNWKRSLIAGLLVLAASGCEEKKPAVATGPDGPASIAVPKIEVSVAQADIDKGKATFAAKGCVVCHKVGEGKLVGPDLQGVLARRTTVWVEKMILKPELMIANDDAAKELFRSSLVPMVNQQVDPVNELPFILSYLQSESKGPATEAQK